MSLKILKNRIAKNLPKSFRKICGQKHVDTVSEIKYRQEDNDENSNYLIFLVVEVPPKMIAPCKYCGVEFNSTNNFIYYKKLNGEPIIDTCFSCAHSEDLDCRLGSIYSMLSINEIRPVEVINLLRVCFAELVKNRQENLTSKQQQCILMLIKKPMLKI